VAVDGGQRQVAQQVVHKRVRRCQCSGQRVEGGLAAGERFGVAHEFETPVHRIPQYVAASHWQPHRWRPLDESKTTAAQKEKLAMRLTSPQREMRQAGIDPDEVLAELREWQAKTADLPAAPVPAAAPTPPAPPADPEDDTDDDTADQAARLRVVAGRGG
jgi:hypothetical protein